MKKDTKRRIHKRGQPEKPKKRKEIDPYRWRHELQIVEWDDVCKPIAPGGES